MDGTADHISRDQIFRRLRRQGNIYFLCSADHEQDWQPYPVDPYSTICDDHTYDQVCKFHFFLCHRLLIISYIYKKLAARKWPHFLACSTILIHQIKSQTTGYVIGAARELVASYIAVLRAGRTTSIMQLRQCWAVMYEAAVGAPVVFDGIRIPTEVLSLLISLVFS